MSNIVEDVRNERVIRVEAITAGGRIKGREVQVSKAGRLIGKRRRYVHMADTKPMNRSAVKAFIAKQQEANNLSS
jgi:hypothetical protein